MASKLKTFADGEQLIKYHTNALRRKTESVEHLTTHLNSLISNGRRKRRLKKVHTTNWTNGRCYNIQNGEFLLTVTNLPKLSFLDLPEYTINYKELNYQIEWIGNLITKCQNDIFFSRWPSLEHYSGDKEMFENLTNNVQKWASDTLLVDYALSTAIGLLHKWNPDKFRRVFRKCKTIPEDVMEMMSFTVRVHCRALLEHCNDSQEIVDYFINICSHFPSDDILNLLTVDYLYYFLLHMGNLETCHPYPDQFEQWIIGELKLVERALIHGWADKLHTLLSYGWPSIFTIDGWKGVTYAEDDDERREIHLQMDRDLAEAISRDTSLPWHKAVLEDANLEDYWSPVFMALFVVFIFVHIKDSTAPKHAQTACIRLLWRSVPSPYMSKEDIEQLVKKLLQYDVFARGGLFYRNWKSFRKEFFKIYPKECLAPYQPRSLLHLCRYKVRETLNYTGYGNILDIPQSLKSYLNLEW